MIKHATVLHTDLFPLAAETISSRDGAGAPPATRRSGRTGKRRAIDLSGCTCGVEVDKEDGSGIACTNTKGDGCSTIWVSFTLIVQVKTLTYCCTSTT